MKITKRWLIEQGACIEAIEKFEREGGEGQDVWERIELLRQQKDSKGYIGWYFEHCKLTGLCESWYKNGQQEYKHNYKDGKQDGLCEGWHENGQLRYKNNFKDGKQNGLCEGWYENGQLMYKYNYKDGKQDGLCESWYMNGQLMYKDNYKDGERIS